MRIFSHYNQVFITPYNFKGFEYSKISSTQCSAIFFGFENMFYSIENIKRFDNENN
jgi:hypothetical protein